MPERDQTQAPVYSAEDARGGEIILRSRTQRMVFGGALVAAILLVLLLAIWH